MKAVAQRTADRIAELELRLNEAEETLRAIRHGEVDALVVTGQHGEQVFTLQGAETPYRLLIEEMNEGALLLAPDGTILHANARFANLLAKPLEEVIGSSWFRFFLPSERPQVRDLLVHSGKSGSKAEFNLELGDGATRPVEVSLASMKREGIEGFSVVVTDLTHRKAAEETLRASNTKLLEMVGDLERFSYSISHDLRAPLRAMKSFAELLENQCAAGAQVRNPEWLRRISAAATRLDSLIQGALDYACVVKQDSTPERVDLDSLLPELLETYPNLAPDKADIQIQRALPVVLGNEAALTQVFSNLLGNAVKFVGPGTRAQVRVWWEPPPADHSWDEGLSHSRTEASQTASTSSSPKPPNSNHLVRVWVEDNGVGIPAKAQNSIFEMYQRARADYEGTGIGLAIVRKAVERMHGRVGVESQEGKGSRFWVELPAAEEACRNKSETRNPKSETNPNLQIRILSLCRKTLS